MGRPYLGAGEINRIYAAENVLYLHKMKEASANWAEWAKSNPLHAEKLAKAMMAAIDEGFVDGEHD